VLGFFKCKQCQVEWQSTCKVFGHCKKNKKIPIVSRGKCPKCEVAIGPYKTKALRSSSENDRSRSDRDSAKRKRRVTRDRPQQGRAYGYYRCSECRRGWESAYTFVADGKAQFGQKCKSCRSRRYHKAYDWKALQKKCPNTKCNALSDLKDKTCAECGHCFDDADDTHIDPHKNHIQELCARCWNRAQPCSAK